MSTQYGLEWISCDVKTKGYNVSKKDRVIIKRQAMAKAGVARRTRGNYGQVNKGQYPLFVKNEINKSYEAATKKHTGVTSNAPRRGRRKSPQPCIPLDSTPSAVPRPISLAAWERATTIDGVSLFQLWTWTEPHARQAVSGLIHRSQHPMVPLLREPKRHLNHIPDRYGQSECLDHAVQALMAKVRELIDPTSSTNQASVLVSHGQALRTIQKAISYYELELQPDLLCAIDILSLVEILSKSGKAAWAHHVTGASLLIKLRGPQGFQSAYEKDIVLSLVTPITCESFRRNEECFFEEQCWQEFLDSLSIPRNDSASERHNMSLQSRKIMSRLPGFFARVSSIVCHDRGISGTKLLSLIADLRTFCQENDNFYEQVKELCDKPGVALQSSTNIEFLYDLLAASLVGLAGPRRLLAAVGDLQGPELEEEARKFSRDVVKLKVDTVLANGWASFHLSARASIGKSILRTAVVWKSVPGEIIEKWRFDEWCKALRVSTCNCKIL